jgi:hypothetical protein
MYDLVHYNPKMGGNVYRITRKCGKSNCRCAHSKINWHPEWILEYTELRRGRRIRKREYVPKAKVKALRQQIKRAKAKDRLRREKIQLLLTETPKLLRRLEKDPLDAWAISQLSKLIKDERTQPVTPLQQADLVQSFCQIISADLQFANLPNSL